MSAAQEAESRLLRTIEAGETRPLYLVRGEPVLAEAAAKRLATALQEANSSDLHVVRKPVDLGAVIADLRTYSLFSTGKVVLVTQSAVLAQRGGAAFLIDQAAEAGLSDGSESLDDAGRRAASRLLQALRLFDVDPYAGSPTQALEALPGWAFEGAPAPRRRKRTKKQIEALQEQLAALLERARAEQLRGFAESDLATLSELLEEGLPPAHSLVLCESQAPDDHPIVERLQAAGSFLALAEVQVDRRGSWSGLQALGAELEQETGVGIERRALEELARRTLRGSDVRGESGADHDSTARFAAEYRKLAGLGAAPQIGHDLVLEEVRDRGEENVWAVIDALGDGSRKQAVERLRRFVETASDPLGARLFLFSQIAQFCRHLCAVASLVRLRSLPSGERNYQRFKSRIAPRLQEPLQEGIPSPIAKLHPFRMHRAYLAASRLPAESLRRLPFEVLQTEMRIKGESTDPDAALSVLAMTLLGPDRRGAVRGR